MEKYEPLRNVGENLYCVDGDWSGTPWRRRMTVIALKSGELVIHSAIRLSEQDMAALDKLGRVTTIIAPNIAHGSEAQWYADRYPAAKVLVPYDAGGRLRKVTRIDGTLEDDWPGSFDAELQFQPVLGTRLHEAAFFHKPSRTLILTDLVLNLSGSDFKPGWLKRLAQWNGVLDRFGTSKLFDKFLVLDVYKLRSSIDRITEWDFSRIVLSHGKIVETDGQKMLKDAFAPLFRKMPERRTEPRGDGAEETN